MDINTLLVIALAFIALLAVAMVLQSRDRCRLMPLMEATARQHGGTVRRPWLGMPQLGLRLGGRDLRLTAMNKSTSSPEGGGPLTCVDFDVAPHRLADLRVRERRDARRNAMPVLLKGGHITFSLDDADFDRRFHVEGQDPAHGRRVLGSSSLRDAVMALPRGADVQIRAGRCLVAVDGFPQGLDDIDRLLAVAGSLLAALEPNVG